MPFLQEQPRKLLIATTNRGKRKEVLAVVEGLGFEMQTLADYAGMPEAVEDADTFEGNAVKKATHYSTLTGILTLADDSGLEVDALNGAPGVHSARFAGPDAKDHANNMKLQEELIGVPDAKRTARFRCVLALAKGSEVVATTTGTIEGLITTAPAGSNGFGYDPYFYLPDRGCTAAELSPEQKNKISHRGQALRAMRRHIENLTR